MAAVFFKKINRCNRSPILVAFFDLNGLQQLKMDLLRMDGRDVE